VVVDSTLVGEEIFVHSESGFNGTTGSNQVLDGSGRRSGLDTSSLVLLASRFALVGLSVSRDVWVAGFSGGSVLNEEVGGIAKVSSLAAMVVSVARDHLLGGEDHDLPFCNSPSVCESLCGSESPAGTAALLVSDGTDPTGPLTSGVEAGCGGGLINEGGKVV
jgi:hypothetical protein